MMKIDEHSDESNKDNQSLSSIEKNYIASVIKEIINNGSFNSCELNNNTLLSHDNKFFKLASKIYDLSGTFYYVR